MDLIFTRAIRRGSTLVDADSTPTLMIVRVDTGATVKVSGTLMTRDSLGRYSYTLTGVTTGVTYRATYTVIVNGRSTTSASEKTAGVDSDVTASEMVSLIKAALRKAPIGVVTVIVDGQTVSYSRSQALEELKFWKNEAAQESGTRPRAMSIDLRGF